MGEREGEAVKQSINHSLTFKDAGEEEEEGEGEGQDTPKGPLLLLLLFHSLGAGGWEERRNRNCDRRNETNTNNKKKVVKMAATVFPIDHCKKKSCLVAVRQGAPSPTHPQQQQQLRTPLPQNREPI